MSLYYQDEHVTLHHGDCLEVLPSIRNVNMILTDPPYGTTRNRWDVPVDLPSMWDAFNAATIQSAATVITAQTPFDKVLGASNLRDLRYEWIWEKGNATGQLNANRMPMKAHENVLVFYRKLPTYNPQKTTGHPRKASTAEHARNSKVTTNYGVHERVGYDSTERYPRSVLRFPSDKQTSALHPTQKPVELLRYMIRTYTNPGDIVLDPFAGSGSALIAAMKEGRRAVGIELDEAYCEVIAKRCAQDVFDFGAIA